MRLLFAQHNQMHTFYLFRKIYIQLSIFLLSNGNVVFPFYNQIGKQRSTSVRR